MRTLPEYTDGVLSIYRIEEDTTEDFPKKKLVDMQTQFWYRELSVYDRLRYQFEQGGKEVTMKVCIPQYREVDSNCAVEIDGKIHIVYNATHVRDKNGFAETELTLTRPERELVKA